MTFSIAPSTPAERPDAPAPRVDPAEIEAALRARLPAALHPMTLAVIDESHLHAGHAGARSGGHYRVRLRSAGLAGAPRIARHRLVYDALADLIPRGIHALAIEADVA